MLVEHLACVAQASDMNPGVFEILIIPRQAMNRLPSFVLLALACNSPVQIEYVELCARVTQQMRDVPESSYALQTKCVPTIADGPIPALIAEDPFGRGGSPPSSRLSLASCLVRSEYCPPSASL